MSGRLDHVLVPGSYASAVGMMALASPPNAAIPPPTGAAAKPLLGELSGASVVQAFAAGS